NQARHCLASEIGRDRACSVWYGRKQLRPDKVGLIKPPWLGTGRHTDRHYRFYQSNRQTDRQALQMLPVQQTDRQTDRQTHKQLHHSTRAEWDVSEHSSSEHSEHYLIQALVFRTHAFSEHYLIQAPSSEHMHSQNTS